MYTRIKLRPARGSLFSVVCGICRKWIAAIFRLDNAHSVQTVRLIWLSHWSLLDSFRVACCSLSTRILLFHYQSWCLTSCAWIMVQKYYCPDIRCDSRIPCAYHYWWWICFLSCDDKHGDSCRSWINGLCRTWPQTSRGLVTSCEISLHQARQTTESLKRQAQGAYCTVCRGWLFLLKCLNIPMRRNKRTSSVVASEAYLLCASMKKTFQVALVSTVREFPSEFLYSSWRLNKHLVHDSNPDRFLIKGLGLESIFGTVLYRMRLLGVKELTMLWDWVPWTMRLVRSLCVGIGMVIPGFCVRSSVKSSALNSEDRKDDLFLLLRLSGWGAWAGVRGRDGEEWTTGASAEVAPHPIRKSCILIVIASRELQEVVL